MSPAMMQIPTHIDPRHRLDDAKVTAIAASMREQGWAGPPIIVVADGVALTGAHRLAAVERLADEDISIEVETVVFDEIAERHGIDPAEVLGDYLGDVLGDVPEAMADELVELGWDWH